MLFGIAISSTLITFLRRSSTRFVILLAASPGVPRVLLSSTAFVVLLFALLCVLLRGLLSSTAFVFLLCALPGLAPVLAFVALSLSFLLPLSFLGFSCPSRAAGAPAYTLPKCTLFSAIDFDSEHRAFTNAFTFLGFSFSSLSLSVLFLAPISSSPAS